MENWKAVPGYEGYYEVSDFGRIRSVERIVNSSSRNGGARRRPAKVLKQKKRSNGYKSVSLCREGEIKDVLVHRAVAAAFCDKPSEAATTVNHKNLHKDDNRALNLEWCTPSENSLHAVRSGAYVKFSGHENRKRIVCVETGYVFPSSYQAAEWVNGSKFQFSKNTATMSRNIRACATGKQGMAFGFHWRDVEPQPSTTIPEGSTSKWMEMGDPA